ncbi:hypothetical protein E3V97_23930 [Pedobacter alluvionis]|uniref:Uncharacterized protein n=1 Tax=Pedobacter alluvionis TaxID=475253 RepID=A0ABY2HJZ9_9SPHI|nr:hypothetical protein E3V97_23930 [Pedobacter alluvionis]
MATVPFLGSKSKFKTTLTAVLVDFLGLLWDFHCLIVLLLIQLFKFKLDTLPGTKYEYNGNAMTILILLLERIYHQPYELLVTNYLKNHLGLYDTGTKIPVNQLNRFIQGYKDVSRPVQWYDLIYFNSYSTSMVNVGLLNSLSSKAQYLIVLGNVNSPIAANSA